MSTAEVYDPGIIPAVMCGSAGSSGDFVALSTGSVVPLKSLGTAASDNTNAFLGMLVSTYAAGKYAAVVTERTVQAEKSTSTDYIEPGDVVYMRGDAQNNKVGTAASGTAIGIAAEYSGTAEKYVSVRLLPYYITGAGGFHA